jgi:hypothetical protein
MTGKAGRSRESQKTGLGTTSRDRPSRKEDVRVKVLTFIPGFLMEGRGFLCKKGHGKVGSGSYE